MISKKMTVSELKKYIKEETSRINSAIKEYNNSKDKNILLEKQYMKLHKITGKNSGKITDKLRLGYSKKKKSELLKQARAIERFEKFDIYTDYGKKRIKEYRRDNYNTLISNLKEKGYDSYISYNEYINMVETFGSLGESALSKFSSDVVVDLYSKASKKEKKNLLKYMKEILADNSNKSLTQEDLADILAEKLLEWEWKNT